MSSGMGIIAVSLCTGIVTGKILIPFLHKLKFGQSIREEGPEAHKKKTGTPTMGGVIFFFIFLISIITFNRHSPELWFLYFISLSFGLIGFADDYLIIKRKSNEGLSVITKFILIVSVSIIIIFFYAEIFSFPLTISLGDSLFSLHLGYGYYLFGLLLLAGTTNAVNITDGVDGLSSLVTAVASLFFIVYAYWYQLHDILIFSATLLGAALSFLYFNWYPAKVFMGDTGSLFLGGSVAGLAMLTKTELLLPIVGAVYVIETMSVIIQVFSFKVFGKRVIKMSPLHHHFELSGWSEQKIVVVFSLTGFFFMLLSLMIIW